MSLNIHQNHLTSERTQRIKDIDAKKLAKARFKISECVCVRVRVLVRVCVIVCAYVYS